MNVISHFLQSIEGCYGMPAFAPIQTQACGLWAEGQMLRRPTTHPGSSTRYRHPYRKVALEANGQSSSTEDLAPVAANRSRDQSLRAQPWYMRTNALCPLPLRHLGPVSKRLSISWCCDIIGNLSLDLH